MPARPSLVVLVVLVVLALPLLVRWPSAAAGESTDASAESVELSSELRALLLREMREIESGMDTLVTALARGEWASVAETADRIEASFVLKRSLTPELKQEIGTLPEGFRQLDGRFHASAGSLAEAARQRNAELAIDLTGKLLAGCVDCHGRYAAARFPGFE